MRIIFGGSFDPVHNGHLQVAVELSEFFGGHQVDLLPCKQPVHKSQSTLTSDQRLMLLEAALLGEPSLGLDCREIAREGPSYSVDTLKELGSSSEDPVVMAIGTDSALSLESWYLPDQFSQLCNLVVLKRPGFDDADLCVRLKCLGFEVVSGEALELRSTKAGLVTIIPVTQLEISSSEIRTRVAQNLSIKYLVPNAVREIICDNRFYC